MTIREIDGAILNCIDPETGEVDTEQLEALEMERKQKIQGIAAWVLDMDGDNAKIDAEIERLTKLKKQNENRQKSLKSYLTYILHGEAYNGGTFKVAFRKSKAVADMDQDTINRLPDEFKIITTKTTIRPDKVKIKKAIDEGWICAGVAVEERVSVTIR